jgi:tetratricopeptide (TPR) repeat protein/tRNA A-37 threonylcarbamoyl transferase component Bud32
LGCLDDQQIFNFISGLSSDTERGEIEAEIARCSRCAAVVAGVMRQRSSPIDLVTNAAADTASLHRYELGAPIARGGMGTILSAVDHVLERTVAVKRLDVLTPAMRARFEREIRITASLQHPNIIPIYDAGTLGDGHPFYAMRHVPGRSLDEVIATTPSEDRIGLLSFLGAVADAVAYAHGHAVIHRDLKPLNVLVGPFGETVVIDWGLAKLAATEESIVDDWLIAARASDAATTRDGVVVGTPRYMAPEQARGEPATPASDVYALGAILYHTLSGVPPVEVSSVTGVLDSVAVGRVPQIATVAPHLPRDLAAIVARAMAFRVADRYVSASELADDLRRFQSGQPVTAYRYTRPDRAGRFARRHRVALVVGSVFAAVAIAVASWSVMRILDARDSAEAARTIAERETDRADLERNDAEALVQFMLSELRPALAKVARLDALSATAARVDGYLSATAVRRSAESTRLMRARVLELRAAVANDRGDWQASSQLIRDARTLLDQVDALGPHAVGADDVRANLLTLEAHREARSGNDAGTLARYIEAVRLRRAVVRATPDLQLDACVRLVTILTDGGQAAERQGQSAQAEQFWREANELVHRMKQRWPDDGDVAGRAIWLHVAFGQARLRQGRMAEAERELVAALDVVSPKRANELGNPELRLILFKALNVLADIRIALGRPEDARALHRRAHDHIAAMIAIEPSDVRLRQALARSLHELGRDAGFAGDKSEAAAQFREAAREYDTLLKINPDDGLVRRGAAINLSELAAVEHRLGHLTEARQSLYQAAAQFQELARTEALAARLDLAFMLRQIAAFERTTHRIEAAAAVVNRALALVETTQARQDRPIEQYYRAAVLAEAAAIAARRGHELEARRMRARSSAIVADLEQRGVMQVDWRAELRAADDKNHGKR